MAVHWNPAALARSGLSEADTLRLTSADPPPPPASSAFEELVELEEAQQIVLASSMLPPRSRVLFVEQEVRKYLLMYDAMHRQA